MELNIFKINIVQSIPYLLLFLLLEIKVLPAKGSLIIAELGVLIIFSYWLIYVIMFLIKKDKNQQQSAILYSIAYTMFFVFTIGKFNPL